MNEFSFARIGKLMRLEFLLHRKYYWMLILGGFLLVVLLLLFIWYQNSESIRQFDQYVKGSSNQWIWQAGAYVGIYIGFKILIIFLVVAQSFLDLRSQSSAERYLLLPASTLEKLISQVVFKFGLAELVLPIVFWLGAKAALALWLGSIQQLFDLPMAAELVSFDFDMLWSFPGNQNWAVYLLMWGMILITPSIFFTGSLFFGKWNIVLTPLSIIVFYLILAGSSLALSQALFSKEESVWSFNISIDQPEIFTDVPLMILLLIFLLFLGTVLSFVTAYYKLKEREV